MATKKKEHKLTPELVAKLRGFSVVSDTIDFTVEIEDVPKEFLPVFTIKNFSVTDNDKIKDMAKDISEEDSDKVNDFMEEITRQHIVGWKNLYDLSTLEEFTFEKSEEDDGCSKDVYLLIPAGLRVKILEFIYSLTGVVA